MSESLVSVFLPTHARYSNGLLPKAVESILAQTHRNFEVFLIDDASSDGSANYLQGIAQADKRATYIRLDNNVGLPAITLAQAYGKSEGEFLAFIFDDNEWLSNHLETLLNEFKAKPDLDMVYGMVEWLGGDPLFLGSEAFDLAKLSQANYIGNAGVMLRRRAVENVGWYDPHILVKGNCDWDLWMRIGKKLKVGQCSHLVAIEKGATQNDSLGLSVTYFAQLVHKYLNTERDHLLSPKLVAEGKASCFEELPWMNDEEKNQLAILSFEHFLRTKQLTKAISLSRQWLKNADRNDNNNQYVNQDIENLVDAFNKYIGDTRFVFTSGRRARYELAYAKRASKKLDAAYTRLANDYAEAQCEIKDIKLRLNESLSVQGEYARLCNQYHIVLGSLSWRVTKPLRELSKVLKRSQLLGHLTDY